MSHPDAATDVIERGNSLSIPSITLVVVSGPDRGKRVRVDDGCARVGTSPNNQLCLTDRTVSRMHCEIVVTGGTIGLVDRGSTNGTFVDGRAVRDVDLSPGTLVTAGGTTFRVDVTGGDAQLELSSARRFGEVVGGSVAMRRVYALLERVAPTDATVLILGETGTGKEVVAHAIHAASPRAAGPFVTLDCGAVPESLVESELFGHVRGAFTGAVSDRKGLFEEAEGGTLFIDEIGELPLMTQPKLLRALESRTVRPVGSNQARSVDVRVIAATNRSLAHSINEGAFREDLYYRLAVVEVDLPPLRTRRDDIPELAAHFLERFNGEPSPVPPEMLSTLMVRPWRGNVRELRNYVERCISIGPRAAAASLQSNLATAALPPGLDAVVPLHLPLKDARVAWTEQFETVYIRALLDKTRGNVTRAAARAGVNRRFLQRAMSRLGIRSSNADDDDDE